MRRLSILFLFLASCSSNERPKDVLSQAKFSALLVEVYLSEARAEAFPVPRDSSIKFFLPRERKLLDSMGISDEVLKKTYTYYMDHPKEFELIYDAVIDTLSIRQQGADKVAPIGPHPLPVVH
ncbi:MAG: DUF4296 domain-containing protein [Cyclobacteriaceae bacterium]